MTKLDDVYMLPWKTILNFETVSEIREQGYSRIPVYDGDRSNVIHVLFAKDLMFIDPDDNMPLSMVCEFYQNDVTHVFDVSISCIQNSLKYQNVYHKPVSDMNCHYFSVKKTHLSNYSLEQKSKYAYSGVSNKCTGAFIDF